MAKLASCWQRSPCSALVIHLMPNPRPCLLTSRLLSSTTHECGRIAGNH